MGPIPEAEVEECAGWISGDEMFPVQALLGVFSSPWKQLRAADHSPKLGAHPTERNGAEVCADSMFVFVSARISDISAGEYLKYPKYHSLLVGKKRRSFLLIFLDQNFYLTYKKSNKYQDFWTAPWNISDEEPTSLFGETFWLELKWIWKCRTHQRFWVNTITLIWKCRS